MSIFDHPDDVPPVPSWRCPHCRTLQAESSRCWRCSRPAVSCSTCEHFRTAVASGIGYCARDRTRTPLDGDEVRPCWERTTTKVGGAGLFDPLDAPAPAPPIPLPPISPPTGRSTRSGRPAMAAKPPLEEPGAAAWAEPPRAELVEAPRVEPGRRLISEVERRRRGLRR